MQNLFGIILVLIGIIVLFSVIYFRNFKKNKHDYNGKPIVIDNTQPLFRHDCDKCDFLGRYSENNSVYDLYFCSTTPTVIARYGNDGAEYTSGMVFARPDGNDALYEAKLRAINKGLCNSDSNND